MTREETRTTYTEDTVSAPGAGTAVTTSQTVQTRPSGGETARRVVIFLFGIIQVLIVTRMVLLLIDAREAHPLVSWILDASQIFVGPFVGILGRDELVSSGSVLDVAALLALVGWTVLEFIVLWGVNVFRRETV